MIKTLEPMAHRVFFVLFERNSYANVNVTNDGWHVCSFRSEAETQEEFVKECEKFMKISKYK